jgi:hypothetical protein
VFEFLIAYRHQNGDLEGFAGVGFKPESAQQDAYRKMQQKCFALRQPFVEERVVSDKGLAAEDLATIQADWEISRRSYRH